MGERLVVRVLPLFPLNPMPSSPKRRQFLHVWSYVMLLNSLRPSSHPKSNVKKRPSGGDGPSFWPPRAHFLSNPNVDWQPYSIHHLLRSYGVRQTPILVNDFNVVIAVLAHSRRTSSDDHCLEHRLRCSFVGCRWSSSLIRAFGDRPTRLDPSKPRYDVRFPSFWSRRIMS